VVNTTALSDLNAERVKSNVDDLASTYTGMFGAAIELMRHA
jgi:hypothetical protein